MKKTLYFKSLRLILLITAVVALSIFPAGGQAAYKLYPFIYEKCPEINSPSMINDTTEIMLVLTKDGKYGIMPVSLENGTPLVYSYKIGTIMGKDQQLAVGCADFPALTKTGFHSEEQLLQKDMVTGIPLNVINCTARPNGYSYTGFLADDEDLISVLIADNRTAKKLGINHAQLAKPLFHLWNLILLESELGNWSRFYDNIKQIKYNGNFLNFSAEGSKGWQLSIFFDEINGRYNIHVDRDLTHEEKSYLDTRYSGLSSDEMEKLINKLSVLDFGEMLPYYISRYGFYEGHTDYRCDPLAIAFIFGVLTLEEIDKAVDGKLFSAVTDHFTSQEIERN